MSHRRPAKGPCSNLGHRRPRCLYQHVVHFTIISIMSGTMAKAYNDSTADVKLQSKDGKVFRVHSYMLKANR